MQRPQKPRSAQALWLHSDFLVSLVFTPSLHLPWREEPAAALTRRTPHIKHLSRGTHWRVLHLTSMRNVMCCITWYCFFFGYHYWKWYIPSKGIIGCKVATENLSDSHIWAINYLDPAVLNRPGRVTQNIKSILGRIRQNWSSLLFRSSLDNK